MDITQAIKTRHSVRRYLDKPIEEEIIKELKTEIDLCNKEGKLNIQLITGDKEAFDSHIAHFGKFSGVSNYITLIGEKSVDLNERVGYYGQRIAIKAQMLGLNTCWVALTYGKRNCKCKIGKNEKLVCTLAVGYGATSGAKRKSKTKKDVCTFCKDSPEWFERGLEAALLAPTAMNQQSFRVAVYGNKVSIVSSGGFFSDVDLGIVKYNFEAAAGKENFSFI